MRPRKRLVDSETLRRASLAFVKDQKWQSMNALEKENALVKFVERDYTVKSLASNWDDLFPGVPVPTRTIERRALAPELRRIFAKRFIGLLGEGGEEDEEEEEEDEGEEVETGRGGALSPISVSGRRLESPLQEVPTPLLPPIKTMYLRNSVRSSIRLYLAQHRDDDVEYGTVLGVALSSAAFITGIPSQAFATDPKLKRTFVVDPLESLGLFEPPLSVVSSPARSVLARSQSPPLSLSPSQAHFAPSPVLSPSLEAIFDRSTDQEQGAESGGDEPEPVGDESELGAEPLGDERVGDESELFAHSSPISEAEAGIAGPSSPRPSSPRPSPVPFPFPFVMDPHSRFSSTKPMKSFDVTKAPKPSVIAKVRRLFKK